MQLCFKCGLYKRGLLHDLSKYGPTEFIASSNYFQGDRSPIEAEKIDKGYSIAWQHHKGHNPHHWEYRIDNIGTTNDAIEIPYEYVVEMICDWVAAGIVYSGNKCDYNAPYPEPLSYFKDHEHDRVFHENTYSLIMSFLILIDKLGVNCFCRYAKSMLKTYKII